MLNVLSKKYFLKPYLNKISILFIVCSILLGACSKKTTPTPTPTPVVEEAIAFTLNPDPGSSVFVSLGATQNFSVLVTSKLPTGGIQVNLKLVKDSDGSTAFSQTLSSTISNFNITYTSMEIGQVYTATINVTSAATATNTMSKTFKMSRK